ncbi:MAG: large conductance mechanosensitive channel protein MscL [Propionibacteriaceae bacterium]|nr:large conductance mechanosensitive channel protein MscL [Propionibacteriaceae bacterium]
MKGFKDFLMQGNLIELATAVIIAGAFGKVVEAFTKIIMDFIGLAGGTPDFSTVTIPGLGINIGVFITALISFVMIAAIVYFFVIKPYQAMQAAAASRLKAPVDEETPAPTTDELLAEIRDLLKTRNV